MKLVLSGLTGGLVLSGLIPRRHRDLFQPDPLAIANLIIAPVAITQIKTVIDYEVLTLSCSCYDLLAIRSPVFFIEQELKPVTYLWTIASTMFTKQFSVPSCRVITENRPSAEIIEIKSIVKNILVLNPTIAYVFTVSQ